MKQAVVQTELYESLANADFIKLDNVVYGVLRPTGKYKTFLSLFVLDADGEIEIVRIKAVKRSPNKTNANKYVSLVSQEDVKQFIDYSEQEVKKSKEATEKEKWELRLYDLTMVKEFEMLKEKSNARNTNDDNE